MQAGLSVLYGQPVNDWQNYDTHIDAVTVDDIVVFAQTYFKTNRRIQLTVRP